MTSMRFDWNEAKNAANQKKHQVSFQDAQVAFTDPQRVIARDLGHSETKARFYCFGQVAGGVFTVRFTYRGDLIRIIGAGYWRKGKQIYDKENKVHR